MVIIRKWKFIIKDKMIGLRLFTLRKLVGTSVSFQFCSSMLPSSGPTSLLLRKINALEIRSFDASGRYVGIHCYTHIHTTSSWGHARRLPWSWSPGVDRVRPNWVLLCSFACVLLSDSLSFQIKSKVYLYLENSLKLVTWCWDEHVFPLTIHWLPPT